MSAEATLCAQLPREAQKTLYSILSRVALPSEADEKYRTLRLDNAALQQRLLRHDAHISCLARQAKILVQEAEERNLNTAAFNTRWRLWDTCRLCKQDWRAHSGGRAGRRTSGGRRGTRIGNWR